MPILTDTSFFVAAVFARDTNHAAAAEALVRLADAELVMPVTILSESMSLIRARLGDEQQRRVWETFASSGMRVAPVLEPTLELARDIDARYADAGFGFADSTLLAVAEEMRTARILTFDRMLAAYVPSFAPAVELLP